MSTPEEKVAKSIADYRTAKGLTYEQLSALLRLEGVSIHPSAIQKTEKSGRKPTISEITAYASVFGVPIETLWGEKSKNGGVEIAKAELQHLVDLRQILDDVRGRYEWNLAVFGARAAENSGIESYLEREIARLREANADALKTYATEWGMSELSDEDVARYLKKEKKVTSPTVIVEALKNIQNQRETEAEKNGE